MRYVGPGQREYLGVCLRNKFVGFPCVKAVSSLASTALGNVKGKRTYRTPGFGAQINFANAKVEELQVAHGQV